MVEEIRRVLEVERDDNFNKIIENYKMGIINNVSLYNILNDMYTISDNAKYELCHLLNLENRHNISGNKKISIIIPTYNRHDHLKVCIDSILRQSYTNFEIIVVDDCSVNDTERFLENTYKDDRIILYKNEKNSGAGYSRKKGYEHSNGEYIIFCDDDDYYIDDNYFNLIIENFKNKDIALICSNSYIKYEKENKYVFNKINFESMILAKKYLEKFQFEYTKPSSTFTAVFRKKILDEAEIQNMQMVNDSSIYMRSLLKGGRVFVNKNIIGVYRVHTSNITFSIGSEFIIKNLEEKKYIYNQIISKNIIDNPEIWYRKQILLTIEYYILNVLPSRREVKKIIKWIKNNNRSDAKLILNINILRMKRIYKKKLKK